MDFRKWPGQKKIILITNLKVTIPILYRQDDGIVINFALCILL
jgi:hypothetical protein